MKIGSIYEGPSSLQDWTYAAKVAASQRKSTGELAPEPAVIPAVTRPARRRKERK